MVQVRFCLLLAALCACCGLGSSGPTTEKPVIIPIPIVADSSSKPAVLNGASPSKPAIINDAAPVQTEKAETISSAAPSSEAPSSATPSSEAPTTEAVTTTTTEAPTTTQAPTPAPAPAPTPAPTPAPGPLPPPEQHTWSYHNTTSNVTCVVIQFAAQVNVTYPKNDSSLASLVFNVPANATVIGGSCDPTEQIIILSWPVASSNMSNTMTLTYNKNDTTKTYGLKSLELALSPAQFANASFTTLVSLVHGAAWPTPLSTSYRCSPATHLNMTGDTVSGAVATLTFSKLQEEAFRTAQGTGFSAARECGGDVPDAVPIAVGCALGGLVLVVLIAYLVGRRRSNARGYLSM